MPGAGTTVTIAGVAVFSSSAAFAAVAVFVGNLAISFALSAIFSALSPKQGRRAGGGSLAEQVRNQNVRQAITPYQIIYGKVRVGGAITFIHTTFDDGLLHMLITISGHEITSFDEFWIDDELQTLDANGKPTSGTWNESGSEPRVRILGGLGTTAGDSTLLTALTANASGVWTTNHKQERKGKFYFQAITSELKNGLPNVTAVVSGKKCFDPRTSTTIFTVNPAVCIRDYIVDTSYGLGEPAARIDDTSFIAAANICEESVNLNPTGTENRYTLNGFIDTSGRPRNILPQILSSCAGTLTYQGGKWSIYVGAYRAPTITYDENDMAGPLVIQTKIGRKEIFNKIKGTFINKLDNYIPTDFPIVQNSLYLNQDQGEILFKDAELNFTVTASMAQRLAKIELEKARQQITVTLPMNLKAMKVQVGDVINLTNSRMSWVAKPFEVVEWLMANRGTEKVPKIGIDLRVRETASTVYDWALGEETTVDAAPDTNLPNPFATPNAPSNLVVVSGNAGLTTANDGTIQVNLVVTWTDPVGSFIDFIETQFKLSSKTDWRKGPNVNDRTQNVTLGPVNELETWDVRIRAVSTLQKFSAFVTESNITVTGKTEAPTDVTTFNFAEQPDGTRIYSWTHANVPADVRSGGGYEIRFFQGTTSDYSAMTKLFPTGLLTASPKEDNQLAAGTFTFAIKAVDSTGNESTNAKFITAVSLGDPRIGTALIVRNESALSWPGTFIDSVLDGNILIGSKLSGDWAALPSTWSALNDQWLKLVTRSNPFYYTTPEIDLGTDVKMSAIVSAQGTFTSTDITMQTGTSSDGAVTGTVTITSSSVANPTNILTATAHGMVTGNVVRIFGHTGSTPDINGFHTITKVDNTNYTIPINVTVGGTGGSSEFFKALVVETIRYIKIRLKVTGTNSSIIELTTIIDSPSATETFEDINTGTETGTFFNSIATGHFQIGSLGGISKITQATITAIQNVGAGYTWELLNKTSTVNSQPAAEFKVYNSSNVLSDAVVDITLRGSKA